MVMAVFFSPKGLEEFPIAEEEEDAEPTPAFFENWKMWVGITVALILFAYTIPFIDIMQHSPPGTPPFDWPIGNS